MTNLPLIGSLDEASVLHKFGWIGVDFDGTLVTYERHLGAETFGEPIYRMIERVNRWLAKGQRVRIVTARVSSPADNAQRQRDAAKSLIAIQDWCEAAFGQILPVVCAKDFAMIELWDDRAVQVKPNSGERADGN